MTCRELAEFLIDYVSGELPPAERRRFDDHLAECPDCVAYLDGYRTVVGLNRSLAADPPPDMPEDLVRAILSARSSAGEVGA